MIFGIRTLGEERARLVAHCDLLRAEIGRRTAAIAGKAVALDRVLTGLRRLPTLLARAALIYSLFRR